MSAAARKGGKAARLEAQVGRNIDESIGATPRPKPRLAPPREGEPRERARADTETFHVSLGMLEPDPDQPRKHFDPAKVQELAANLKSEGQLQALLVRKGSGPGRYIVVCGERRWRAAHQAGMTSLLCRIDDRPADARLAAQLAENLQRDEMNPVDLAVALAKLRDDHGWTQAAIAARIGLSQPAVSLKLGLLKLPPKVLAMVEAGTLAPASAMILLEIPDARLMTTAAESAVHNGLNRSGVRTLVDAAIGRRPTAADPAESGVSIGAAEYKPLISTDANPSAAVLGDPPPDWVEMFAGRPDPDADGRPAVATAAATEAPPELVAPAATKPVAAAVSRAREITEGWDVPDATVTVIYDPAKTSAVAALRRALDKAEAEATGANHFKKGDQVRVSWPDHPYVGGTGEVVGPGLGGRVACKIARPHGTLNYDFLPSELERLAPGKDRRRP